jgi:hypothetical protein
VLSGHQEERFGKRRRAFIGSVHDDLRAARVDGERHLAYPGFGDVEAGGRLLSFGVRRRRIHVQVLGKVRSCVVGVSGAELALCEIQQHRRMRFQRVRLQEREPSLLELMLIVELHALAEALARHLDRGVVFGACRAGVQKREGNAEGAKEPGGVAGRHAKPRGS